MSYQSEDGTDYPYFFDEAYYLDAKLAQLNKGATKWTLEQLRETLAAENLTPFTHYELYGRGEGLNPSAYFNENQYLNNKLQQLNFWDDRYAPEGGGTWTMDMLKTAIADAGMTPAEHYERYGAYERYSSGQFMGPSYYFDANDYYTAKLLQVRLSGETVNGHTGDAITRSDLVLAIREAGLSPLTHYELYGRAEGLVAPSAPGNDLGYWVYVLPDGGGYAVAGSGQIAGLLPAGWVNGDVASGFTIPRMSLDMPDPVTAKATSGADAVTFTLGTHDSFTTSPRDIVTAVNEVQSIDFSNIGLGSGQTLGMGGQQWTNNTGADLSAAALAQVVVDTFSLSGWVLNVDQSKLILTATGYGDKPPVGYSIRSYDVIFSYYATEEVRGALSTDNTSTLTNLDVITGFTLGEDRIVLPFDVTKLVHGTITGVTAADFAPWAGSGAGKVGAHEAGLFKLQGSDDYYLFINNQDASFSSGSDAVIKLAGVSDFDAADMTAANMFTRGYQ